MGEKGLESVFFQGWVVVRVGTKGKPGLFGFCPKITFNIICLTQCIFYEYTLIVSSSVSLKLQLIVTGTTTTKLSQVNCEENYNSFVFKFNLVFNFLVKNFTFGQVMKKCHYC